MVRWGKMGDKICPRGLKWVKKLSKGGKIDKKLSKEGKTILFCVLGG